jgi:polar amino acid transport system substrate-binding protein
MRTRLIAVLLLVLSGASGAMAQTSSPVPIKAGVYIAPPFVMKSGDSYTGYTWELWQQIARSLQLEYDVRSVATVPELLQLVRDKQIDIAVANLTITASRFEQMDFSQPYFDAGLRIMIDEHRHSGLSSLITGLRDSGHLRVYAWIAVLMVAATVILTLIDRRWHPEFPEKWREGFAESFYHVMSVATSGSTSHRNLLGWGGRILGALWLACGVATFAYITSSITSVMTVSTIVHQINSFSDLRGKRVGVLAGSVGEAYCRQAMLDVQSFETMEQMVSALLRGEVSALVRDAPVLEWYDNAHPELPITEVGPVFQPEKYGFALPTRSDLTRRVSEAILTLKENGTLDNLRTKYFGTTR